MLLRDIIDLDAAYGGAPDAGGRCRRAPRQATPREAEAEEAEVEAAEEAPTEAEAEAADEEANISLAAMEQELLPSVDRRPSTRSPPTSRSSTSCWPSAWRR